jgi:prepilin-type N-terminal cleavage/methylation domain-containing protein
VTKAEYIQYPACPPWWASSPEYRFRPEATPPVQRLNALTVQRRDAFTLLELLIVIGIIAILLVLIVPAFRTIKSGTDVAGAIYGVKGVLEIARVYAKTNHTYVFVGFAEVDSSVDPAVSPQVTTGPAPYGRVALAVVASKDGMRHFQFTTSNQGSDWQSNYADPTKPEYRGAHLVAVGKLERYENLHFLVDFPSWTPTAHPNSNMARYQPSSATYTLGNAASATATPFTWPLGSPLNSDYQYRFDKGIYFNPIGVARIATSTNADEIARLMEIDFQPTHGTVVPPVPTNQDVGNHAAIQIAPTSGAIRIYRP